jgi:hypothetical protein
MGWSVIDELQRIWKEASGRVEIPSWRDREQPLTEPHLLCLERDWNTAPPEYEPKASPLRHLPLYFGVGLGEDATNWRVAGTIPNEVIEFFQVT